MAADRIGRADRGDQALGEPCHLGGVVAERGDHGELVAAEPGHQIVAAQRVRQPERDAADQFVADVMAERVVDVLEVVEVDIEHRGGAAAGADLFDHRLQPLAEIDAVGQAAQRVVHGEMTQAAFAGGDGRGGAAHIAQHEGGKQRKARERDRDEGHHAVHDLRARLLRRPGKARDVFAAPSLERVDGIAGRRRGVAELAQVGEAQLRGDGGERRGVDIFHRHQDRRRVVAQRRGAGDRADGHRGDHRRTAAEAADGGALGMHAGRARTGLVRHRVLQAGGAAAHVVEQRHCVGQRAGDPGGRRLVGAGQRIDRPVGAVEDEYDVVVEIGLQPMADVPVGPGRIEVEPKVVDGGVRGGGAFDLAQHALAKGVERARKHPPLMHDRDLVGAVGGGEHGDDDADDGDGDDDADRHHDAQACAVPTRVLLALLGSTRASRHCSPLSYTACWTFRPGA